MANVSDKVAQIRQAVYGKDVRESIASGIEAINDETESTTARQTQLDVTFQQLIINAGNSNAEIVDARGGFDTLRKKIDSIAINVKDFGAKGDGVADDTNAIQAAINSLATDGTVIFPQGKYAIGATINISKAVHIIGYGAELVVITNGMDNIFKLSNIDGFSIRGLKFNDNLKGRTCIDVYGCSNFIIEENYFTGYTAAYGHYATDSAIRITSSTKGKILHNTFENFGNQYDTTTETLNRAITLNDPSVDHILIEGNILKQVNQGIGVAGGKYNIINNNIFDGVHDNCLYLLSAIQGLTVSGNTFRNGYDEAIVFAGENITITGNKIFDAPNKAFAVTGNAKNIIIANNVINNTNVTTGQFFVYRDYTYTVDCLTIENNICIQPTNTTAYDYFGFGNITNLVFKNNTINVVTAAYQRLLYFNGTTATGVIAENNFIGTDPTAKAIEVASGVTTTDLIFENNRLSNCRGITTGLKIHGQQVQFNVGPYINDRIRNNIIWGSSAPTIGAWNVGDICYNINPSAGGYIGWVCVATGTPGTWKGFGTIQP